MVHEEEKKSHAIFHKIKAYLLKWACGIKGSMYLNTEAEGENPAGLIDYMYKPWLLERKSNKTQEITDEMINQALQDLSFHQLLKETLKENSILYLSQPMVEMGKFTIEQEAQCLENIVKSFNEEITLYYKPHPHDNPDKIKYYKDNFKWIEIYDGAEPAELMFVSNPKLKAVISYQSSALMNVDKFAKTNIKAVSLADLLKVEIHPVYRNMMKKAGVIFYNKKK